jgi:hypothetical protein
MAKLKVKNAEGATVGTYIKQCEADLALMQARRSPKKSENPINEAIVAVAVAGLEPERFRAEAAKAACTIGWSKALDGLVERLKKPELGLLQSRLPATISNHEAIWQRAIVEILGHFGREAIPAARSLLGDDDVYIRELSLRLLFLLAARQGGDERDGVVAELRKRVPSFAYYDFRGVVSRLMQDALTDPKVMEFLDAVGDLSIKIGGKRTIAISEIIKSAGGAVPAARVIAPADPSACKEFAARFAAAVVGKDFGLAHGMFCAALKKKYTAQKLAALVARKSKHSGPPEAFEYGDNGTTAAELRKGPNEFSKLPAHVTDANFRRWCCLQFLPEEDSGADACFDWWMAVIEENGLKVGFFHILDAD